MTVMLLEWVFTSAFLILVVLALRAALGRRVSARLRYALWAVVLARLLVPVQLFTSPIAGTWVVTEQRVEHSVVEPPTVSAVPAGEPVDLPAKDAAPGDVLTAPALPDAPEPPAVPAAPDLTRAPAWLGWLWLGGSAAMALVFLVSNVRFVRRLRRRRVPLEGADCPLPVYVAEGLPSPCLLGLIHPAVYVTPQAAEDPAMLRHVLAHEYTHFRQGDHLWSLLRCGALAIHWWNPLVWLSVALSRRDGELACDEGALKRLGDGERRAYGSTLLVLVTAKPGPADLLRCATTMAGDKKSLKERITRVARAPKRWLWAAVAVVLATALACLCAFGRAEEGSDPASGVTADLTFSLETDSGSKPCVRMDGTVDGVELTRGAFWHSDSSVFEEFSGGYLSMVYLGFTDGIGGHITAGWTDEGHTSVTVSTQMSAMLSSLFNVGYWEFTVELDSGDVRMEGLSFREGLPDGETRFYPESISEEEAVRAARIAAKLLTEGKNYYDGHAVQAPAADTLQARLLDVPEELRAAVQAKASETKTPVNDVALASYWFDVPAEWTEMEPWGGYLLSVYQLETADIKTAAGMAEEVFAQGNGYYYSVAWCDDGRFEGYPEYWDAVDAIRAFAEQTVLDTQGVEPYTRSPAESGSPTPPGEYAIDGMDYTRVISPDQAPEDPEQWYLVGYIPDSPVWMFARNHGQEIVIQVRDQLGDVIPAQGSEPYDLSLAVYRLLSAPSVELSLAPAGSDRVYAYSIDPSQYPNNFYLSSLVSNFRWEDAGWSMMDGAATLRLEASDGSASLTLKEGSYLVTDGDGHCWKGVYDVEDYVADAETTPFDYLRRLLFDGVELTALRSTTFTVPDRGQSHEEIAREWAENWEGVMTKTAPGSQYACTYVRIENIRVDQPEFVDRPDMNMTAQELLEEFCEARDMPAEEFGKTWFGFSYETVFVPVNQEVDNNPLWAGNTGYYEGDNAPEGALFHMRVGYLRLIDDNWVCEGTGTGW